MLEVSNRTIATFLESNWGWAFSLGVAMFGLTLFAGTLLTERRRDEIALWLMGAVGEESWSRSFTSLFDAVFGERHLSLRCIVRSSLASLCAVLLIWLLMGGVDDLGTRIGTELSLGAVLVAALAVNLVADYVSLLETRFLLGRMHRFRSIAAQAGVLLVDLALSAAIIWLAILAFVTARGAEMESFAEILGVFSLFSVLFYSTFLTSVWTWGYVGSTWLMRLFSGASRLDLLAVDKSPFRVLGVVLGALVTAGALLAAIPMQRGEDGIAVAESFLCEVFKGRVCEDVARLTPDERRRLEFILGACEGGVTEACFRRGGAAYGTDDAEAARLFKAACDGGDARACTGLGWLHHVGFGMAPDPEEAARLYRRGCDGGNGFGCTLLGWFHETGTGMDPDQAAAARLYRQGCDGGFVFGCTDLGRLHENGIGMDPDPAQAARLYRQACDGGDARGCTNLGLLHAQGIGVDPDPAEAARLYRQACEMGHEYACAHADELDPS